MPRLPSSTVVGTRSLRRADGEQCTALTMLCVCVCAVRVCAQRWRSVCCILRNLPFEGQFVDVPCVWPCRVWA